VASEHLSLQLKVRLDVNVRDTAGLVHVWGELIVILHVRRCEWQLQAELDDKAARRTRCLKTEVPAARPAIHGVFGIGATQTILEA